MAWASFCNEYAAIPQVGYQASYNIYNFDQEDPASNRFDVTSCYGDFATQPFILEFAGKYEEKSYLNLHVIDN